MFDGQSCEAGLVGNYRDQSVRVAYRLLAIKLEILFRCHGRFLGLVRICGIDPLRNVGKDLLCSKHAVGIQA